MKIEAVLFDKDGTILDFHSTWDLAVGQALRASARSSEDLIAAAAAIDFDLDTNTIPSHSLLLAESTVVSSDLLRPHVDIAEFTRVVSAQSATAVVPARGLPEVLSELETRGVKLAVVTNDFEASAVAQMEELGWRTYFGQITGCDSGFGAKPDPGMVLGTLDALGVNPASAVMVGDTSHDLRAARSAGVITVLTVEGMRGEEVPPRLSELADVTVSHLGQLIEALTDNGCSFPG